MKKLIIASLCFGLVGFFACGQEIPRETTSATTIQEKTSMETNIETTIMIDTSAVETTTKPFRPAALSTAEIKALENGPFSDAFAKEIERYAEFPNYFKKQCYVFYDIDGNDAKELLLGMDWDRVGIYLYAIHTIQDNVAVRQDKLYVDPDLGTPFSIYKNGTIRMDRIDDEVIFYYYYFRLERREIKFQTMINKDDHERYYRTNAIDKPSSPITKEEFDRVQKEMEGDGQVVELDWKPLAEYGR